MAATGTCETETVVYAHKARQSSLSDLSCCACADDPKRMTYAWRMRDSVGCNSVTSRSGRLLSLASTHDRANEKNGLNGIDLKECQW